MCLILHTNGLMSGVGGDCLHGMHDYVVVVVYEKGAVYLGTSWLNELYPHLLAL